MSDSSIIAGGPVSVVKTLSGGDLEGPFPEQGYTNLSYWDRIALDRTRLHKT